MPNTSPTRKFWQEAGRIPGYPLTEKIHGWFYLRFPYFYIATATGSNRVGRFGAAVIRFFNRLFPSPPPKPDAIQFADTYHGKVVPLQTARELVSVKENVRVPDLERVIPYKLARSIILDQPDHLAALDCPCRVARENPCLPLDVCLIIGEPFVGMVLKHHPKRARAISSAEAVAILEVEEARGHVHHAFFKEAVLERFYAICNCCSCCCGAMQAHQHGTPMLASSGYVASVDESLCQGCGECEAHCQFAAITVIDGLSTVNFSECMGCGICVSHCAQGAIELALAPAKGIPLEMSKILGG